MATILEYDFVDPARRAVTLTLVPVVGIIICIGYAGGAGTACPAVALAGQGIIQVVAQRGDAVPGVCLGQQIAQGIVAVAPVAHVGIRHAGLASRRVVADLGEQ
jgi:hypothetical protein